MMPHPPPDSVRKEVAALTGKTALYETRAIHEKNVLPESVNPKDPIGGYQGAPLNMTGIAAVLRRAGYPCQSIPYKLG